jgi:hypothetical protein
MNILKDSRNKFLLLLRKKTQTVRNHPVYK